MTDEPYKLFDAELRFMEILWANQPVSSGALARLCQEQLGWKRTTTYTVLKKLCTRGLAQNSPEDVDEIQSWIDDYRRRNGS